MLHFSSCQKIRARSTFSSYQEVPREVAIFVLCPFFYPLFECICKLLLKALKKLSCWFSSVDLEFSLCVIFCTLSPSSEIVASTSNNDNLRVYDSFRGAIVDLHTKCKSTSNLPMLIESKNFFFKIKLILKI